MKMLSVVENIKHTLSCSLTYFITTPGGREPSCTRRESRDLRRCLLSCFVQSRSRGDVTHGRKLGKYWGTGYGLKKGWHGEGQWCIAEMGVNRPYTPEAHAEPESIEGRK